MLKQMNTVIAELNSEFQKLNEGGSVPYINGSLVLGMLQTAAEATLTSKEIQMTDMEKGNVFASILAITKAIVSKMMNDEKDGLIIWVPRTECEIKDIPA